MAEVAPGTADDLPRLQSLLQEAAHVRESPAPMGLDALQADFIRRAFAFLVARLDGAIIGVIMYTWMWDEVLCDDSMRLCELCVLPSHQDQGLEEELLRAAWQRADTEGKGNLQWQLSRGDEAGVRLCERLGARMNGELLGYSLEGEALRRLAQGRGPNPLGVKIRLATERDEPKVAFMIKALAQFEGQMDSYVDGPLPFAVDGMASRRGSDGGGSNLEVQFLLAEVAADSGGLVGLAAHLPCYDPRSGRGEHVQCLVVSESARRQGVALLLMQAVARHCVEAGLTKLLWRVYN